MSYYYDIDRDVDFDDDGLDDEPMEPSDDYDIYGGCEWGPEPEPEAWEDDCYDYAD